MDASPLVLTLCRLIGRYHRFRVTYCLHLHLKMETVFLQNVSTYLRVYVAQKPRTITLSRNHYSRPVISPLTLVQDNSWQDGNILHSSYPRVIKENIYCQVSTAEVSNNSNLLFKVHDLFSNFLLFIFIN
jgi:hypothetical protein